MDKLPTNASPALALALVSTGQALISNLSDKPMGWLVEHYLANKTKEQGEKDAYGLRRFFHDERLAPRRLDTVKTLATLAVTATATLGSILLAVLVLIALALIGANLGDHATLVGILIGAAFLTYTMLTTLLVQAARGKLYGHVPGKVDRYSKQREGPAFRRLAYNAFTSPTRYWTALWSLQTLTPYRTVATLANLLAVYASFEFS